MNKEYNPFSSNKLYAQCYKWSKIERGKPLPPPTTISIDPSDVCNLACSFCNSRYERSKNSNVLSGDMMSRLGYDLEGFCESVCIGGGGEPLTNRNIAWLIEGLDNSKIKIGMVSNGTILDRADLGQLTWLGVSVNAGKDSTYNNITGRNYFNQVIKNIKTLNENTQGTRLQTPGQGHGVSYKYLLTPENVDELYEAAKIAKDIGCRNIHIRPVANPWDRDLRSPFSDDDIKKFKDNIQNAHSLEDKTFGVFGITDKFDGKFNPVNDFSNCYAIFMNGVIQPPTDPRVGNFNWGMCCDRRGDKNTTFQNLHSIEEVKKFWGSEEHWEIFDKIQVENCPRCLHPKMEIMTKEGIKIIEEIKLRDLVLTKEGNFMPVKKIFKNEFNGNLINIHLNGNNLPIRITPNHKLPTVNIPNCNVKSHNKRNGKCFFGCYNTPKEKRKTKEQIIKNIKIIDKMACELNKDDDFLLIPKLKCSIDIDKHTNLMRLLGYYLSGGTIYKDKRRPNSYSVSFYFSDKEIEYHKEVEELVMTLFSKRIQKTYTRNGSTTISFSINKEIYSLFKEFGIGAHNKKIPFWVLDLSKEDKAKLLSRYFYGDGCFEPRVSAFSVSKQLLSQIKLILT